MLIFPIYFTFESITFTTSMRSISSYVCHTRSYLTPKGYNKLTTSIREQLNVSVHFGSFLGYITGRRGVAGRLLVVVFLVLAVLLQNLSPLVPGEERRSEHVVRILVRWVFLGSVALAVIILGQHIQRQWHGLPVEVAGLVVVREEMKHVERHGETGRELWVEALREGVEHGAGHEVGLGAGRPLVQRVHVLLVLDVVFGRVVVIVSGAHAEHVERAPDAIFSELFEFEALTIFSPDVHEERVVRDAEYPGGLAGCHFLIPYVLQCLGEFGVGPGTRRSAAGGAVLAFWAPWTDKENSKNVCKT